MYVLLYVLGLLLSILLALAAVVAWLLWCAVVFIYRLYLYLRSNGRRRF